ncbi:unnamed protein product [Musa acuminata subsp. malaccensis]|uniref:(wild Malaysian banana) hypothetical protein n=1 Tax=Musa acuminata subsp. malaccensis TaxID=214687 RepID=A0A804KTX1_MUSAM|nr:unnamed protein product [Musa acuminata subsp. malaccensis]
MSFLYAKEVLTLFQNADDDDSRGASSQSFSKASSTRRLGQNISGCTTWCKKRTFYRKDILTSYRYW